MYTPSRISVTYAPPIRLISASYVNENKRLSQRQDYPSGLGLRELLVADFSVFP